MGCDSLVCKPPGMYWYSTIPRRLIHLFWHPLQQDAATPCQLLRRYRAVAHIPVSCWLCLAPYDVILRDGNHKHYPSCKHYVAYDDPVKTTTTTTSPPIISPYFVSPAASAASITTSKIGTFQPTSITPPAYSPPPYMTSSAPSTSQGGNNPPYMASSAPSTSQGGNKWYKFWKGR
jgi:hypothetical protein